MSTHTPGPWIPVVADGGALVTAPDGYAVCALPSLVRDPAENLANAELIAMAPDLLRRLVDLASVVRRSGIDSIDAEPVDADEYESALDEAETLIELLAESGVTVGEPS